MRRLPAVLMLLVALSSSTSWGQDNGKELGYRFQGSFGYQGTVSKIDGKSCQIRDLRYCYPGEDVEETDELQGDTDFVEGFYLGMAGPSAKDLETPGKAIVLRVEVDEITSGETARLLIGEEADRRLESGWAIRFFRPTGVTTKQMRAMPAVATFAGDGEDDSPLDAATSAALSQSRNNLKQLGLALHNFHESYGRFPPAVVVGPDGKPWHSWRVLLLPFLDEQELFDEYRLEEPWNSPHNAKLVERMPAVFGDPVHGETKKGHTHYAVVTGEGAAFGSGAFSEAAVAAKRFELSKIEGGPRIRSLTDGTSNTLAIGPVSPKRKIPWTKPEDVLLSDAVRPPTGEKGFHWPYATREDERGAPFLAFDGSVHNLPAEIDGRRFRGLLTPSGAEVVALPSVDTIDEELERITVMAFERTDDGYRAVRSYELYEE